MKETLHVLLLNGSPRVKGNTTLALEEMEQIFAENKYFTIANMPVASSQYWNCIHGREKGEAKMDEEGRQTMRVLARNMVFLMKSIALGKEQFGLPDTEPWTPTHFIR